MPPTPLTRRQFLSRIGAPSLLASAATYGYAWRIEPHWVEVVRRELPIENLPPALEGRTLVQLSDLHVGPEVDDDYLVGQLERVSEFGPDIVALTGDFMTSK